MKILKILAKWLQGACVWYSCATLLLLLVWLCIPDLTKNIHPVAFLLFFPFGLCMSGAGLLMQIQKIPVYFRWLLHFAIFLVSFILLIFLPAQSAAASPMSSGSIFVFIVLLSVLYWLIFLPVHLLSGVIKKHLKP